MDDVYDLKRFISAQEHTYPNVIAELMRGRKTSHWIWYIFPQVTGLGSSATSEAYSIKSLAEARGYLAHPLLGARLKGCTSLVLQLEGRSAQDIFGYPDYLKFRSCMTLFAAVADGDGTFRQALDKYYDGVGDERTLGILAGLGDSIEGA